MKGLQQIQQNLPSYINQYGSYQDAKQIIKKNTSNESQDNDSIENFQNQKLQTSHQNNSYTQQYSILKTINSHQEIANENFKVCVRVRPPLQREIDNGRFISTIQVSPDNKQICIYEYDNIELIDFNQIQEYLENPNNYSIHQFSFDHVYDQEASQLEVYENTAKLAVLSTLEHYMQGFNATIIAYGQTGTGKTHTMEGFRYNNQDPNRGIIPRATEEIFKFIESCNSSSQQSTFMVRASYLQIYMEQISDLLRNERQPLQIREDKKRGVFVEGLSEWAVRSPNEIFKLMQKGAMSRASAQTKLNDISSRSHAIFQIIVEQMIIVQEEFDKSKTTQQIKVGKLNLVDLAGSERVRITGATGIRLEECKKINQSLSCLGNVIAALTDIKRQQPRSHIPYRDSKLTRILEDSLGGNCKTTFMAMISSAIDAFPESLSSLKFANRAKNIKNVAFINEDVDQRALLRKYEVELKKLRQELQEKNKHFYDNARVFQLEEARRKAQQDKFEAQALLEQKSKEFFQERDERKKLEEKIKVMNSQMLIGGQKIEDTPQFQSALEIHSKKLMSEFELKLQELEKERNKIEEEKAQVDQYKNLLLKQRDIMVALTARHIYYRNKFLILFRLNERDETIQQQQEELDAFDRIHKETEDLLDIKIERIIMLEHLLQEKGIQIPQQQQSGQAQQKKQENEENFSTLLRNPQEILNIEDQQQYQNQNMSQLFIQDLKQQIDDQQRQIEMLNSQLAQINTSQLNGQEKFLQIQEEKEQVQNDYNLLYQKYEEMAYEYGKVINENDDKINKEILIQGLNENNNQKQNDIQLSQLMSNLANIKQNTDSIINTLSQVNDKQKLQRVASDLLKLQEIINNTCINTNQEQNQVNQFKQNQNKLNQILIKKQI